MSDNDNNDDRKEREDLTRIEDLSEFLHSEDDDDLSDLATDPDINIPDDFSSSSDEHEITDFDALENDSDEPPKDEFPEIPNKQELVETQEEGLNSEPSFELEDNFQTDEIFSAEDNFGSIEDDPETDVEFLTEDDFTSTEDDFTSTEDDFTSTEDDFTSTENDFASTEDDFASTENDFASTENDFATTEDDFASTQDDFSTTEDDFASTQEQEEIQSADEFKIEDNSDSVDSNIETEDEYQTIDDFRLKTEDIETVDELEVDTLTEDNQIAQINDPISNHTNFNQEDKIELPKFEKPKEFEAPENFKQLQQFAKNMSYGNMAKEGNPPFSIIIKDIKFEEDVVDILILLKELKVIDPEDEENAKLSLERGTMLLPRLGEYSAITICHKLRRFDINILMGLTEEINPPKSYESDDRGLTTKNNIYNNRKHNWNFDNKEIGIQDIIVSTTPTLNGYDITDYITVATEFILVDMENFTINKDEQDKIITNEIENTQDEKSNIDFFSANMNLLSTEEKLSINDIYKSLIEKLKSQAIYKKANGVVGINFQVSPILVDDNNSIKSRYQITCSGSIVWVIKK